MIKAYIKTDMKLMNSKVQSLKSELLAQCPTLCLEPGANYSQPAKLASCLEEVDTFLEGGLPFGSITEFGMPLGKEGRVLLLKFLANATQGLQLKPLWTLWISCHHDFQVFPPAWFARGVSPSRMIFTYSPAPMQDLKRAIINPLFKLIVLDSPSKFSREDCFFLTQQARSNHQLVILLRNFFLTNRQGNIWAKLRINCWKRHSSGQFVLKVIRGLSYRQLLLDQELLP